MKNNETKRILDVDLQVNEERKLRLTCLKLGIFGKDEEKKEEEKKRRRG